MQFIRQSAETEETQRVRIVEAIMTTGAIPWSRARHGQRWRPTSLSFAVERHRANGGEWGRWWVSGTCFVMGVNIKSDGTRGAERGERLHHRSPAAPQVEIDDRVRAIVEELNALGDLPAATVSVAGVAEPA